MISRIKKYLEDLAMSYRALRDVSVGRARITKKGKVKYKIKKTKS